MNVANRLAWVVKAEPDVVGLQELKAEQKTCVSGHLELFA
jgi:exonuclease III